MTPRQRKFCDEYLISGNATDAAIKAGYSPKTAKQTGSENLAKPDLKAYIETELEKLHSAKIADAEEVMKYLTSVMRGEHTEEIPILCGDGCQELTQKEVGAKERLKAAELIGKRYGMFTDKVGVEGAVPVIITGMINLKISPQAKRIHLPEVVGKGYGTFWNFKGRYRVCKEAVLPRNPRQRP